MVHGGLEPWQLLIVAIVIILLFGTKKLPGPARALGRSMRLLKSEAKAVEDEGTARSTTASTEPAGRLLRAVPSGCAPARPTVEGAGRAGSPAADRPRR
ncbi:Sec-independent protein translocase subunit TatA [Streptomyces sp. NPDC004129]|uniref:Sec-independent protein translocase subunit TatA n=1 Tax=Streptomyces sp. NPDC004533 TaxID=3154278 RepID=UPI0033B1C4E0